MYNYIRHYEPVAYLQKKTCGCVQRYVKVQKRFPCGLCPIPKAADTLLRSLFRLIGVLHISVCIAGISYDVQLVNALNRYLPGMK